MTTPLRITPVAARRDLERFLAVPAEIYRGDPHYIAPLRWELRQRLDRRHGPFFEHGEAEAWIAWRGERPVGRISAQINRLHLELHGDGAGNFGFLEAVDDGEVFAALLATAESWLKARGMKVSRGPYSLSINDEVGVLVSGFDSPPVLGMAYSPVYYAPRLEALGYGKAKDLHALLFLKEGEDNRGLERLERVVSRLKTELSFSVRPIDMRRFEAEMSQAIALYNDAWSDNWGFVPVTEREVGYLVKQFKMIIEPDLVLFGEIENELAGIFITLPNLNEKIADLGGRLFPLGWAKLLWRLRFQRFRSSRVVLSGVRKAYRESVASPALLSEMLIKTIRNGVAKGFEWAELSWVIEDNARSMALCQRAGARVYKTYRIYEKALT